MRIQIKENWFIFNMKSSKLIRNLDTTNSNLSKLQNKKFH